MVEDGPFSILVMQKGGVCAEGIVSSAHGSVVLHNGNKSAGVEIREDGFYTHLQVAESRKGPFEFPEVNESLPVTIDDEFSARIIQLNWE